MTTPQSLINAAIAELGYIVAITNTILKKLPTQGSTLPDDQKVTVLKGKTYGVAKIIKSDGLHTLVELESGAGTWWIFLPHWDTGKPKPLIKSPTTGLVTAIFTLKQAASKNLIYGSLSFFRDRQKALEIVATSGAAGFQYPGAHTVRGRGCIPPAADWKISTEGYYLTTRGVEGVFFHITPDPRFGRSEIGLHRDANVPGSAGCIVVKDSKIFNNKVVPLINGIKDKQYQIGLSVIYT